MKKPSQGTWIIAGLSAAFVIAVGGFVITQLPVPHSGTAADSPQGASATQSAGSGPAGPAASPSARPGGGSSSRTGGGPENPPPTAGKRYTTEVIPAAPATPHALPPSTVAPRLVSGALPTSASATGALAAGFPGKELPPAPGSKITSSSVATQGSHLQLTLVAKAPQGVTDIVAFYRTALAKYGMYDTADPAVAGSTAVAFTRGADSVTVTATPGSGGTSYVLYGAFSAAG